MSTSIEEFNNTIKGVFYVFLGLSLARYFIIDELYQSYELISFWFVPLIIASIIIVSFYFSDYIQKKLSDKILIYHIISSIIILFLPFANYYWLNVLRCEIIAKDIPVCNGLGIQIITVLVYAFLMIFALIFLVFILLKHQIK